MIWAHAGPDNPYMFYWWTDNVKKKGLWNYFRAFQGFMSGIPVSNGNYVDALSVTSNSALRAWGQKDLTNNCAHLWIDNTPYTWKAVVDHSFKTSDITWSSTATYASTSIASDPADTARVYKSLQNNNKNRPLTDPAWWEDRSGDWWTLLDMKEKNPPLPPPVSGTVTVSGFANGVYKCEWWDTSTGVIVSAQDVVCSSGNITLTVSNLVSDVACKIYQAPPNVSARPEVATTEVRPGQTVTITVRYVNSGGSAALNAVVRADLPVGMTYVAGSAEATGGTYDAMTRTISWTLATIPAGAEGTRAFQARVD